MTQNLFDGGPKVSETIEQSIENQSLNKEYEQKGINANPESTKKIQEESRRGLYGEFMQDNEKEKPILSDSSDKVKEEEQNEGENKFSPIFKRLLDLGKISIKTFNALSKQEEINLGEIEFEKEDNQEAVINLTNELKSLSEINSEGNLKVFLEDFKDVSKQIENKEVEGLEEDVYKMIGKNYLKIETGNVEEDKRENFKAAVKVCSIEIRKEHVNLPISSETYKKALKNINSDTQEKQFEGLHSLFLLASTTDGAMGPKVELSRNKLEQKRKKELISQYNNLNEQLELAKLQNNKDLIPKIEKEILSVVKEAQEIEGGIFGGDKKIEINDENPDKTIEAK